MTSYPHQFSCWQKRIFVIYFCTIIALFPLNAFREQIDHNFYITKYIIKTGVSL